MNEGTDYRPRRIARSQQLALRGLEHHLAVWGEPVASARPTLVMLHGWMDVGASFQFVVDEFADDFASERCVIAPDWRGFGLTESPGTDSYWFPDYLGDLDALLDALSPDRPVDLVGHSMGGNVAMVYAGVRPERVRRLINLEGFGMPQTRPQHAPARYAKWLDELKAPASLRSYESVDAVAERLRQNNPLISAARAAWLAPHWARLRDDGRWHVMADAAHKHVNPVLYQKDEALACWERITAPVLWVEGDRTDVSKFWGHRYPRAEFDARLAVVANVRKEVLAPAGHMLHHDQPEALARLIEAFLDAA